MIRVDASFQVEWSGGPTDGQILITFTIENETVATVNQDGIIVAHEVGTTLLVAQAEVRRQS